MPFMASCYVRSNFKKEADEKFFAELFSKKRPPAPAGARGVANLYGFLANGVEKSKETIFTKGKEHGIIGIMNILFVITD